MRVTDRSANATRLGKSGTRFRIRVWRRPTGIRANRHRHAAPAAPGLRRQPGHDRPAVIRTRRLARDKLLQPRREVDDGRWTIRRPVLDALDLTSCHNATAPRRPDASYHDLAISDGAV